MRGKETILYEKEVNGTHVTQKEEGSDDRDGSN